MGQAATVGVHAHRELERRRRERRLQDWNVIDALYKAYMTALVGAIGLVWLSGVVADESTTSEVRAVVERAPGILGLVVAAVAWAGVRSGVRGGPLTVVPSTVRIVLLAPLDRGVVLRAPAVRQLRFAAFVGVVAGAAAGAFAARRFGGPIAGWALSLGVFAGLAGVLHPGTALLIAGRAAPVPVVKAFVVVLGAGAAADALAAQARTPFAWAGRLGVAPAAAEAGTSLNELVAGMCVLAALAAAASAVGLSVVGRMALEPLEHRSRLVALLRFAATMRDLRAVILFRRQLGQEAPRARPWRRVPGNGRFVVWRRDWQGVMRWPAVRFLRLAGLGVVAGLATVAAMAGPAELVMAAAVAVYVAAAEATEGFAQEADHPTLRAGHPLDQSVLWARHLAVPTVLMSGVGLVAVAAAALVAGPDALVAVAVVGPGALVASVTTSREALADPVAGMMVVLGDPTGMAAVTRAAGPPLMAGSAPVLLVVLTGLGPPTAPITLADAIRIVVMLQILFGGGVVLYHLGRASRWTDGLPGPLGVVGSRR